MVNLRGLSFPLHLFGLLAPCFYITRLAQQGIDHDIRLWLAVYLQRFAEPLALNPHHWSRPRTGRSMYVNVPLTLTSFSSISGFTCQPIGILEEAIGLLLKVTPGQRRYPVRLLSQSVLHLLSNPAWAAGIISSETLAARTSLFIITIPIERPPRFW